MERVKVKTLHIYSLSQWSGDDGHCKNRHVILTQIGWISKPRCGGVYIISQRLATEYMTDQNLGALCESGQWFETEYNQSQNPSSGTKLEWKLFQEKAKRFSLHHFSSLSGMFDAACFEKHAKDLASKI